MRYCCEFLFFYFFIVNSRSPWQVDTLWDIQRVRPTNSTALLCQAILRQANQSWASMTLKLPIIYFYLADNIWRYILRSSFQCCCSISQGSEQCRSFMCQTMFSKEHAIDWCAEFNSVTHHRHLRWISLYSFWFRRFPGLPMVKR